MEHHLLDEAIVHTSTKKSEKDLTSYRPIQTTPPYKTRDKEEWEISYPMTDASITSTVKKSKVTLKWEGIPDDNQKYKLYRNGKLMKVVSGHQYTDTKVKENKTYIYTIVGYKKLPQERIDKIKEELEKKKIDYDKGDEKNLFYERKELRHRVVIRTSKTKGFTPPPGYGWILRYKTFIPMKYADNPQCPPKCTYDKFNGNNRGFDPWATGSHAIKTHTDVYTTFKGSKKYAKMYRNIGVTIGYKKGKVVKKAWAPKSDLKLTKVEKGNGWIAQGVQHQSAHPLIFKAPTIDVFYYAKVYKNKLITYGVHDFAPSHEFYLMNYPGDFVVPIHRTKHRGFLYLWFFTPKAEFYASF
ncbi:DUF3238 domain-containing protein [Salinithrix halophila]|uniref:DUF3238 domain-containing protein n=1 Tax=Salinithrix halophila TaxID=1485204 RepID=A0ABV8JGT1_9BACL